MQFKRAPQRAIVLLLLLAGSLLVSSAANAAGTLDQQQPTTTGAAVSVGGSNWPAQTFTAGVTGRLDQVDLFVSRVGNPGDLTLQIQAVAAGVPSGAVLATTTVPQSGITSSFTWLSVPLASPAQVTAGAQYAIVLSAPSPPGINFYGWSIGAFDAPYAGGKLTLSITSGATWGAFAAIFDTWDTAFKTYVSQAPSSIADCLKDGWQRFAQFKNEGDCVSFVATRGDNEGAG
jgi:hypothetical protein